jgi:hypothetical protein
MELICVFFSVETENENFTGLSIKLGLAENIF